MARIKITDSPTQELGIEDAVKQFDLYQVDKLIHQIVDFLGTETSLLHKKFVNLYSTAYEIVLADIKQKYKNLNIIKLLTDWYTIWVRYISHVDFLLDGFTDKCRTSIRYVYRARTDNTNISFRKDEKEAAQTMNLSAFSTNFLNMGKASRENLFPNAFAIGEKRDKTKVSLKESIITLMDYGFSIIGGELDAMRRTLINQAEALNCALKKSYNVECVSEFSDRGRSMYFVNRTTREKYLDLQPTKRVIEDGLALINGSNKKIVLQLLSGDIEYDEYRFDFDAITDNHPVFMQSKLIKDDKHSPNKDDSWPSAIDKIDKKRKREEISISINSRDSGSSLIPMKNSIELSFADKSYKSSGTKKRKLFSCPRSEDFPNSHSQNPIVPSTGVVSESELCATLEDLIESDIDDAEEDEEASISEYLVAEKQFIFLNGDDSIQNNEIVRKLVLGKFDKIIADERDLIKIYWEFILNNFDYEVAMESGIVKHIQQLGKSSIITCLQFYYYRFL